MNESITFSRRQIGQWASIVAAIGLLLGIIGLIWQGGLTLFVILALLIGGAATAVWAYATPDEFRDFITGRQVRHSTGAVFSTILVIGIITLAYIFLQRSVIAVDLTEGERFTLSPETQELLDRLEQPMQITGFYSPGLLQTREVDDQFFRPYEINSDGLIQRVYIDPEAEPLRSRQFEERFGIVPDGSVFISLLNPDGSVNMADTIVVFTPDTRSANQERDMTNAINRLMIRGQFVVYVDISHGGLDPFSTENNGMSQALNALNANGIVVEVFDLQGIAERAETLPDDVGALMLARPVVDLTEAEIVLIDQYLQNGGSLYIMTDVAFSSERPFMAQNGAFNEYIWQNYGIRALDAIVVDPLASLQTDVDVVGYAFSGATDIGARLDPSTTPTLFRIPRALEVSQEPPVNNGWVIVSSPNSYGKTDFTALTTTNDYSYVEGVDIPGQQALVAWAWNTETDARILLVGDGDFVTNGFFQDVVGNRVLLLDGFSWLLDVQDQIGFAPQFYITGQPLIFIDGARLDLIAFLTVILLPGIVLASGMLVWWRRSRG